MSSNPNVRYIENKNKEAVNRNQPVGCTAITEVGNVQPLGHVCRWKKKKKKKKMSHEGEDLSAAKPERGRLRGTLGGRYNQARRKEVNRERPVGWRARAGSMVWDLKGSQQEADGQQRAT